MEIEKKSNNFLDENIYNHITIEKESNMIISNHGYNYVFKILLVGDSSVGKSSLVLDIINATYNEKKNHRKKSTCTLGVDFSHKILNINQQEIKVQIWDTAGQERFHSITSSYFKSAHGILLVFDLNNIKTLKNINFWIESISKFVDINKVPIVLIGNKCDLVNVISEKQIIDIVHKHELPYFVTKFMDNSVNEPFNYLIKLIYKKLQNDIEKNEDISWAHNTISLNNNISREITETKKCCNIS